MSIPPQIAQALAARAGGGPSAGPPGGAPGAPPGMGAPPGPPSPGGAPAGSPMSAPSAPNGQREAAMAQIGNCLDSMEMTLPKLGAETEEGQAVMDALRSLAKVFGKHRAQMKEIQPAAQMMMMRGLQGARP